MKNKVTMDTIAAELGISKVSVSKALNQQPGISEELRKQIFQKAHELGYIKNKNAKASHNIKHLSFIIPKRFFFENESFYTRIYYYLLQECNKKKINLGLHILSQKEENDIIFPVGLQQSETDGIFIVGEINAAYFHSLINLEIPAVVVDFYKTHMKTDYVIVDNYHASFQATTYLIECGHKKIGFVGNHKADSSINDRYYGYLKALDANGLEYNKSWHIFNKDINGNYCEYTLPDNLPTAFICHCDLAAYHLMVKLRNAGISLPQQVSLVSFDNTELCEMLTPRLTSVDIDKKQYAQTILSQMEWRIDNPASDIRRILLETKLVERESVQKHAPSIE